MKFRLFIPLSLLLLCFASLLQGQIDLKIRKKDFRNDKSGLESAWQNVLNGDLYFKAKGSGYGNAFGEYFKASLYNGVNAELNYKTGVSALYSDNKEEAVNFLQKAYEVNSDITEDILFFLGRALQYAGKYNEAIDKFNAYLNDPGKKPGKKVDLAKRHIEECGAALDIVRDTLAIIIKTAGSGVNSNADDYSAQISADGVVMYFASRREMPKSKLYDDVKFDENIFVSGYVSGEWGIATLAGKNLTTRFCEAPVYLSPSGDEMYLYAGYENGGDIKMSVKKKGNWKDPVSVPFRINSGGMETSLTFSPQGDEVWFVTDKGKDGLGGKDIYYVKKEGNKKWSKPVNAGPAINTTYDEESISFSPSGDTLWFSSQGHNSLGGFDIFYSVKDGSGEWGNSVNYGYPVNTPWDELYFTAVHVNERTNYFASNRSESIGGLDIFTIKAVPPVPVAVQPSAPPPPEPDTIVIRDTVVVIREIAQAPPVPVSVPAAEPQAAPEVVFFLTGKVTDSETGEPVMAKIDLIDLETDAVALTTASSDIDGSYRVRMPSKKSYMVDLRAAGFLSDMKRINIAENYPGEFYNLDVSLIRVKVGKKVVLNNILFETGKSILTSSSFAELDRLLGILNDNPLMKIEISGHTDKTGSEPLNFKLSGDRAGAVVEYLVQKGISRGRLESKGYGSLQPIADNATAAGRSQNRRVEFKILEF